MYLSKTGIALYNLLIAFYTDVLYNEIRSVDLSLVHSWVVKQDTFKGLHYKSFLYCHFSQSLCTECDGSIAILCGVCVFICCHSILRTHKVSLKT